MSDKPKGTPRGSKAPIDNKASLAASKKPALKPTRVASSGGKDGKDPPPSSSRKAKTDGATKTKAPAKAKAATKGGDKDKGSSRPMSARATEAPGAASDEPMAPAAAEEVTEPVSAPAAAMPEGVDPSAPTVVDADEAAPAAEAPVDVTEPAEAAPAEAPAAAEPTADVPAAEEAVPVSSPQVPPIDVSETKVEEAATEPEEAAEAAPAASEEAAAAPPRPPPPETEPAAAVVAASADAVAAAAEEAAAAAGEDAQYADESMEAWNDCEGSPALDAALGAEDAPVDAPIRLVDARFLCALAKADGRLVRRQDLPDGAFFDVSRLKRESYSAVDNGLRVLAVAMPWLATDHPDPSGIALKRLSRALEGFIEEDGGSYAIFLPYCSIMQMGLAGEERTAEEAVLYDKAVASMSSVFAHDSIILLSLSALPDETDPSGVCAAAAASSGWAHLETTVASLTKPPSLLLDMAKFEDTTPDEAPFLDGFVAQCRAARPPPVLPVDFGVALQAKAYEAHRPADAAALASLYETVFNERFLPMDALLYDSNGWGDAQIEQLCTVLSTTKLENCKQVWLSKNEIESDGMARLASCIGAGALPALEQVHVHGNFGASFASREEIRAARSGIEVHYDGMGGGRTNHAV